MKYLLLYGKLTSKKPKYYCAYHKCGINGSCRKHKCAVCRHFRAMTDAFAIKYSGQIKLYSFCPKICAIIKTNKEREHGFQKN